MRRGRKLSLRARMLIVLVGVTTVLLLVMGIVSTYLLGNRVNSQVAATDKRLTALAAALVSDPQAAAQEKVTDYAVVEVRVRAQLTVVPLTSGSLTTELASATAQQLKSPALAPAVALARQGRLGRARLMLASLNCGTFPSLGCKPFEITPGLQAASRWVPADRTATGLVTPNRGAILLVAQQVDSSRSQVSGFILAELVTGAALVVLVALGGEWLIGRGLAPLDTMTRTANDITDRGDLTERMPDADHQTEVGRLGSSINTMLDRIQQAFSSRLRSEQKVREFAADASHELRTPLTTIRGYAELYRQGALGPDQLPNAMRRIEQEAERMSVLVAELLELARLDRTTSLDLTETDLAGVIRDAVADAIAVEPQRPVRAEAPDRLVAVVDEARIRQVLANLLGNVRAHTPPVTPVVVRLGAVSGGVLLEVADAGPGMPAEDAARAFDRFHRASDRASPGEAPAASGEAAAHHQARNGADDPTAPHPLAASAAGQGRRTGQRRGTGAHGRGDRTSGSGLGLSIVQAIAMAHGGLATLESVLGQGTRVRVWLPVRVVA